jgi:hypothetical protein
VPGQQAHRLLQRQGEGAVALRLGLERAMRTLLEGQARPLGGALRRGTRLAQANLQLQRRLPGKS